MDVELYVYDLSRGLARQFSLGLTGIQIDAIYHTSIVLNGVEYFFGLGVQRKVPGTTHYGKPMEILRLGQTDLPLDVIQEYIRSLATIYTAESYDLFLNNCNNFTQDLSMFLVGKEIPEHIRSLPQKFLGTPIGQMLRGQIDQSMRQMTQAPDADMSRTTGSGAPPAAVSQPRSSMSNGVYSPKKSTPGSSEATNGFAAQGMVHNVTSLEKVESLLKSARNSCAAIFFTSATCPPCKIAYPTYDELAIEAGEKATLIKVDLSQAYDVGAKYNVRVTPTFMTFLKGEKENEWSGANPAQLRANIKLLIQMAWPEHAHQRLRLPSLQRIIQEPVMYKKVPPLDKLVAKIGPLAQDQSFIDVINYVKAREKSGPAEAPSPNLHAFSDRVASSFSSLPTEVHFAVIDLIRIAAVDTRISSFLATEKDHRTLLVLFPPKKDYSSAPYNLQVVSLQLACNLFGSPIFQEQLMENYYSPNMLRTTVENLASTCLLAPRSHARFLASALVYNIAAHDHNERMEDRPDKVNVSSLGDLEAALIEAVINEVESKETLHGLLLALGLFLYKAPAESSTWELCTAMDVRAALAEKATMDVFADEPLLKEIGDELLAKGGVDA